MARKFPPKPPEHNKTPRSGAGQQEPVVPEPEPGNQPQREPNREPARPDAEPRPERKEGVVSNPDF